MRVSEANICSLKVSWFSQSSGASNFKTQRGKNASLHCSSANFYIRSSGAPAENMAYEGRSRIVLIEQGSYPRRRTGLPRLPERKPTDSALNEL
jgi:hypothetical protein